MKRITDSRSKLSKVMKRQRYILITEAELFIPTAFPRLFWDICLPSRKALMYCPCSGKSAVAFAFALDKQGKNRAGLSRNLHSPRNISQMELEEANRFLRRYGGGVSVLHELNLAARQSSAAEALTLATSVFIRTAGAFRGVE